MSMILKDDGTLTKGVEILVRQLLKMMNLDPEVTLAQISGIHNALVRHTEQQADIIQRLERIENEQRIHNATVSAERVEQRQHTGGDQQSAQPVTIDGRKTGVA